MSDMRVFEIFHSIQGESSQAGLPCVFVRLTGCNLRCAFCDTQYAYEGGVKMSLGAILDTVRSMNCELVEITGGEPLLQAATPELALRLLDSGFRVLVETNGSFDISLLDSRCSRIMDIKCPSSGEMGSFDPENIRRLTPRDEVKFVLANEEDYSYARECLNELGNAAPRVVALLSPAFGTLAPSTLVSWMLRDKLRARLNLQLHKYVWPPETRGV
jgi:7-carboxy-7-deazaguanine synthase